MKLLNGAWNFKDENFGPLLPYVQDPQITDVNYNGSDVWVEHLEKGIYKADVELTQEFVNQFCVRIANLMSRQFNRNEDVLEAETDPLRNS